jgi:polyhydroxyalkanoate synthase
MQAQQIVRRLALPVADLVDRVTAAQSRAMVHAHIQAARLLRGRRPIDFIAGPATEHELVVDGPLARIVRYRPPAARAGAATPKPVVVVASLINKYYVMDLLPELSVLDLLRRHGLDLFVLDWKAPGDLGPQLRFEDYVDGAIAQAVEEAARAAGANAVGMIGYCMGGTLAAMYAARHAARVRSLVLLGTPIDFHQTGELSRVTRREVFDAELLMDVYGNMPPALMQSGFKLLHPMEAVWKLLRLHLDGAIAEDEARARQFVALESWLDDNSAFPGGVYRRYIRDLYQDNALVRGAFTLGGDIVDLRKITAPLLNVIALKDHICAPPASRALMPLVSSTDKRALEFDTGHIGLTTSRKSHEALWPEIAAWLEARL